MPEAVLQTAGLHAGYGETVVLEDVAFTIAVGHCVSILGRNGVGKSTFLETIMGHTDLHGGTIKLAGKDISATPTHQRVAAGLGYVPQEREVFPSLSVQENLLVASKPGEWSLDKVYDFFPLLAARSSNRGNQLSGGEQQMLAIGRALMGNPSVLLMDEPSEGLAPVIVETLQAGMARLRDETGMTIILVEQNSKLALGFAERCLVINRGRVIFDGASTELNQNEALRNRLLGVEGTAGS